MKKATNWIIVIFLFITWSVAILFIYQRGKERSGIMFAEIPQETVDFIQGLSNHLTDVLISFNPNPKPKDWDNGSNIGEDPQSGLLKIEDEYFIIYYHPSSEKEAQFVKEYAHKAIRPLAGICGRYYYPEYVNGRKLPIYLANTKSEFVRLNKLVSGISTERDYTNTAGVYISEASSMGCLTKGIVINNELAFTSTNYAKVVLWHEMTHYVFFTSLNYTVRLNLPMWSYEGIAEYCAREGEKISFTDREIADMREQCDFETYYFPYVYQNYRGGESIYRFMEIEYSKEGVTNFLLTLYSEGVSNSLEKNFRLDVKNFEQSWKNYLPNFSN